VSTRRGVATIVGVVGLLVLSQVVPNLLSTGRPGGLRELGDQGCERANAIPRGSVGDAAAATLCLLNAQRRMHGLKPLRAERHLDAASERYARVLVQRHWFEHVTPEGVSPLERMLAAGFHPRPGGAVGENLAWGSGEAASPVQIVDGWMHSPGHRANILRRRFRRIGIGIVTAGVKHVAPGQDAATYVTDFG
jgi:uncharacterized protein YkwD